MRYVAFKDKDGNLYEITINGNIYLTLNKEKRKRNIGKVDYYNKALVKDEKNTHIFRKTREFGFSYEILKYLIETGIIDKIRIELGSKVFTLEVNSETLKDVNFRYYKGKGFERQVFIPISRFKMEDIRVAV